MNFPGIGKIIDRVGDIADDLITTDEEKRKLDIEDRKLDIEEKKIDQQSNNQQIEVNKTEAAHRSVFVAGWRPFIGWVCGTAFAYHFIIQPLLFLALTIAGKDLSALPEFDISALLTVLGGMLGLGGLRTFEKLKGKAR